MFTKRTSVLFTQFLSFLSIISVLLFSFAPWLALENSITRIIGKILYVFWFGSFSLSFLCAHFDKRKVIEILPILFFIFIYVCVGFVIVGLKPVLSYSSSFLIPLFLGLFLYVSNAQFSHKAINNFIFLLNICCFFNGLYALFLISSFGGDFSTLYISNANYQEFNYIRNGRLRAFGFLNSAVIFSNYVSLVICINIFKIEKKKLFLTRLFFLFFCFFILYSSGSRMPFIALFISFLLIRFFNKRTSLIFGLSIIAVPFILFFLSIGKGFDLSALGRISQYRKGIELFIKNPLGYGIGYAGFPDGIIQFDCSILTLPVNFGVIGIYCFLCYYFRSLKKSLNSPEEKNHNMIIVTFFLLSTFVNVIHLGVLSLFVISVFIKKQGSCHG